MSLMNKTERGKSFNNHSRLNNLQSAERANVDIKEILNNKSSPRNNANKLKIDSFQRKNTLQSKLLGETDIVEKSIL